VGPAAEAAVSIDIPPHPFTTLTGSPPFLHGPAPTVLSTNRRLVRAGNHSCPRPSRHTRQYSPLMRCLLLFEPVSYAAPFEVVGADLDLDAVARQNADPVHPHLPRIVGEHFVPVIGLDAERRVFKGLDDRPFQQDGLLLSVGVRQCSSPPLPRLEHGTRPGVEPERRPEPWWFSTTVHRRALSWALAAWAPGRAKETALVVAHRFA